MGVQRISPEEAHARMRDSDHRYVDVRSEIEFDLGHPEGAYNVPWQHQSQDGMIDNPAFLTTMRRAFAPDTPLVIGCRTGHRSLVAAQRLVAAGFDRVLEMKGGYEGARDPFGRATDGGWRDAGLPTSMTAEPGRTYRALSKGPGRGNHSP